MRRIALITAFCAGCSSSTPSDAPTKARAEAHRAAPKSVATEPPKSRWLRAKDTEPDPVAKGLYRQAVERVRAGQLAQAEPLFAQLAEQHPQSRFARRLATEGFPIVEAAKLGTVVLMFGLGTFLFTTGGR